MKTTLILCGIMAAFGLANPASAEDPAAPFGYAEITVMQDGVFEGHQAGDVIRIRVGVRLSMPDMFAENDSARVGYGTTRPGVPAIVRNLKFTAQFTAQRAKTSEPFLYLTTGKTQEVVRANCEKLMQMGQPTRMSSVTGRCAPPTKEPGSEEGELITSTIHISPNIQLAVPTAGWEFAEMVDPMLGSVMQITLCQEE